MSDVLKIATVSLLTCCFIGCGTSEKDEPIWEQVKIGDIAPTYGDTATGAQPPDIIGFEVSIFELPAENIEDLDTIWQILYTQPLRFSSYTAFEANLLMARYGQSQMLNRVHDLLVHTDGKKLVTVSLLLPNGQANDITVIGLPDEQRVSYISADGSSRIATVGPGICALRMKAEKVPNSRGVCKLVTYPVFTVPSDSSIPQLAVRAKSREFSFTSAAFGLRMSPGDFVVLGPKQYIADKSTLCGLFFGKPEGSIFFSRTERTLTERKPAVRVFVITCSSIGG